MNTTAFPKGAFYMRPRYGYILHEFATAKRLKPVGKPHLYRGWTEFKAAWGTDFPTQQSLYDHIKRRCVQKRKTLRGVVRDHLYVERLRFNVPVYIARTIRKKSVSIDSLESK